GKKLATTVQSATTGAVANCVPSSAPPQPSTAPMRKPFPGITVNRTVAPSSTPCGVDGDSVPPGPASGVTTQVGAPSGMKRAMTVQSANTAAVVYVLPSSAPPQPSTSSTRNAASGVTVNATVSPSSTTCSTAGASAPPSPA